MTLFEINSDFSPKGDQEQAIKALSSGISSNKSAQVLLGITGSGKTFTVANVIQNIQKPTLILAHNKTLAAQLYQEFKEFFPNNAVEYFVSYYDYYQPEAYVARTDTYIEKDMSINDRIDRLRLSATRSLIERKDVIIVASVSCIYGLGIPEYYIRMKLEVESGSEYLLDKLFLQLVDMHYTRSDFEFSRGNFRVKGDVVEIFPAYEEDIAFRLEFFGDDVEKISIIDALTGKVIEVVDKMVLYPGSHHVTPEEIRESAIERIKAELKQRTEFFDKNDQPLEKFRIHQRTNYDLEMIREMGFCKGIENYSRHFSGRAEGDPAKCLIDYFPEDMLLVIDESHQTIPQIRAMYNGDRARKESLVEYGFRLPSAFDNRPLKFEEFYNKIRHVIYVSATPGDWEVEETSGEIVEQVIRPTGLLDPIIEVKPADGQVDDVLHEIKKTCASGHRVLVTTLTKKLAENLTEFLKEIGISSRYIHSDIDTLERMEIINELRKGEIEVLVGVNLLREGLDMPEVALVCILDADKEGFLRSQTALVQTCGRAARNAEGRVIMYANKVTKAIESTISISKKRRELQIKHNKEQGITPQTIYKKIIDIVVKDKKDSKNPKKSPRSESSIDRIRSQNKVFEKEMKKHAKNLDFEKAAYYRDKLREGQAKEMGLSH
ncbi:MAG: excinuclease ABC subunit UvrB [Chlamydiales bacterium]|nr:excinuclease ABC subunit UvrB [Chlamydiales bacterium]